MTVLLNRTGRMYGYAAASGITPVYLAMVSGNNTSPGGSSPYTLASLDTSGQVGSETVHLVLSHWSNNTAASITSVTLAGNTCPLEDSIAGSVRGRMHHYTLSGVSLPASSDVVVAITSNGTSWSLGAALYRIPGATTFTYGKSTWASGTTADISANVSAGNGIVSGFYTDGGGDPTWVGATEDQAADINPTGDFFATASAGNVSAAALRTITATGTSSNTVALSIICAP